MDPKIESFSFMKFIYPFRFDRNEYPERTTKIGMAEWRVGNNPRRLWKDDTFPEEDLLQQVSQYLNPSPGIIETAHLWMLNQDVLLSPDGLGAGINQNKTTWNLTIKKRKIRFEIEAIRLCLFRIGIGFLTIDIHPRFESLSDWFDFAHYFRFINRVTATNIAIERKIDRDKVVTYIPPVSDNKEDTLTVKNLITGLLQVGDLSSPVKAWWSDVFVPDQLLPYTGLFLKGVFSKGEIFKANYRIGNFFHSKQEIHPSDDQLNPNQKNHLEYARQQWFLFSQVGAGFVAYNAPETIFFKDTLPQHLQNQYYLIYLLALHQKFALNTLSNEVAERWLDTKENLGKQREDAFQKIRDSLLTFKARGYYSQLMHREHHHSYYCRWREILQLPQLYNDVCSEISDINEYLLMQKSERMHQLAEEEKVRAEISKVEDEAREKAARERNERLDKRLSLIAWMIGLPLLGLQFQAVAWGMNTVFAIINVAVTLTVGYLIYRILRYFSSTQAKKQ